MENILTYWCFVPWYLYWTVVPAGIVESCTKLLPGLRSVEAVANTKLDTREGLGPTTGVHLRHLIISYAAKSSKETHGGSRSSIGN
jgi:hypothetical protein